MLNQPLLALLWWLGSLGLLGPTELLRTVFSLLAKFARRLFYLGLEAGPNQPVFGLELSLRSFIIVNQSETSAPSTTKVGPEAEGDYAVFVRFVHGGELLSKFVFRDIWAGRVEDIENKLAACEKAIGDEFASAQCYRC